MPNPEPSAPLLDLSDLKFQPAWINETSNASRFFGAAEREERPPRGDRRDFRGPSRDRDSRPARPGPGTGPRGPSPRPPERRDDRGPKPAFKGSGPRDDRRGAPLRPRDERDQRPPEAPSAPVRVEFMPEGGVVMALAQQIRNSHLTFPLFGLAKKFLEKPEYHVVRLTVENREGQPPVQLYRVGEDGPVTLDRRAAERMAFERARTSLYEEKTELGEPPKGNFSNVARCRLDGTLLGPTNHHGYQLALRALYDSRYSRRMSFEQFRREIETVNDPAAVEKWKEESRSNTTFTVVGSEPSIALGSLQEVRQHFEEHHLAENVRAGSSFTVAGPASRGNGDPGLNTAMRYAWEAEARHPLNLVQHVRAGLQKAGLQIFKHRKKFVYVSAARPIAFRAAPDSVVSANVQKILDLIAAAPGISRKVLAERILGPAPVAAEPTMSPAAPIAASETPSPEVPETVVASPDAAVPTEPGVVSDLPESETPVEEPAASVVSNVDATPTAPPESAPSPSPIEDAYNRGKSALVADLRWLAAAGHVLALHDGTYDLPQSATRPEGLPSPASTAKSHPAAGQKIPAPRSVAPAEAVLPAGEHVDLSTAQAEADSTQSVPADEEPPEEIALTEDATAGEPVSAAPPQALAAEVEAPASVESSTPKEETSETAAHPAAPEHASATTSPTPSLPAANPS